MKPMDHSPLAEKKIKKAFLWKSTKGGVLKAAIILSIPALTGIFLFYYIPIIEAVRYSFHNYQLISGELTYIGLDNYTRAFQDPLFLESMRATLLFFILKVPLLMISGLGLALLVQKTGRGVGTLRTIILLPTVTSMVVVTTVWGFMYHPDLGLFNSILNSVGLPSQKFLTSPTQAMPSIVILTIWKDVGLTMLFYLAGLLGIPQEYYEAARIDGANGWQQLRFITIPALRGTNLFILVTSSISAFRVFIPIFMTTQGGPMNTTRVIMLMIYQYAFRFNQMGYAATLTVILAVLMIVISLLQFLVSRERKAAPLKERSVYKTDTVPYL